MNKFQIGWKAAKKRKEIQMMQVFLRVFKRGYELENKEFEENYPKCKVCGERRENNEEGKFIEGEFICFCCQKEIYN